MENVYSPPIGALNEPIALAAQNAPGRLASVDGMRFAAGCASNAEHYLLVDAQRGWPPDGALGCPRPPGAQGSLLLASSSPPTVACRGGCARP